MVRNLLERAKSFIGLDDDGIVEEIREDVNVETALKPKRNPKASSADYQIVIYEPKIYDDSMQIASHLRSGCPVLINLRHIDQTDATRLIDFVCGTTFAIDGNMTKIDDMIFLFSPSNIAITDVQEKSIEDSINSESNTLFSRR